MKPWPDYHVYGGDGEHLHENTYEHLHVAMGEPHQHTHPESPGYLAPSDCTGFSYYDAYAIWRAALHSEPTVQEPGGEA